MKLLLSLSFFICLLLHAKAQNKSAIPAWVSPVGIDNIATVNKKQIKDGYYYVLSDEQFNTIKRHSYFHYAIVAVTEEALVNVSQIEFNYDPSYEKAMLHSVTIHRGAGVITKTAEVELKELREESERNKGILNGRKTLYANLSDIRKGDIVEYSFSIVGENPIMKNYFNYTIGLSYSVPAGKLYSRLICDNKAPISLLNKNTTVKPLIKKGDVTEYIWEVNNPLVVKEESSTPSWYSPYHTVQISNIKTWNEVKVHCRSLLTVGDYNKALLQHTLDSITDVSMTDEQKITALISFVQTHVRYSGNENGIYSHVPRDPLFVLKNRFGDCKEKSVLLCELFKLMGIESYPVLVNTNYRSKVKNQNPSLYMFNHCISCFNYKGMYYYVDPTISYQRGDFRKRLVPNYETGMVLDAKETAFETIPTELNNKSNTLEEFSIEESGDTKLKVTTVCKGYAADDMRYTFLTNSVYDIQDYYKQFYYKYTEDIDVLDTVRYTDNEEENEFTVVEFYRLNKFWTANENAKTKSIDKDFIPYSLNTKLIYGEESKRNDPLEISYPLNHSHVITIDRDGGWDVEGKERKEDNRFFSYSYICQPEGNKLNLIYEYVSKTAIIEPKDYKEYKSKMDFIDYNMVFNATQKPIADGTMGFNWSLLLSILVGMSVTAIVAVKLYKKPYESVHFQQHESIGGWLVLLAINMALSPLVLLASLYREYHTEMAIDYVVCFLDVDSPYFSPLRGYYTLFSAAINSGIFVFTIFVSVLFFQRKASFRPYFVGFRIFNVVFLIVNLIIIHFIYGNSDVSDRKVIASETSGLVSFIVMSCIWVPYIWFSERSKGTFTKSNTKKEFIPEPLSQEEAAPLK